MRPELEQVTFRRVALPTHARGAPRSPQQLWDMVAPQGHVFARAEIYEGENQWGVRLFDKAPDVTIEELMDLVGKLLVWEIGCRADTVEVVLGRNNERRPLVLVGGEYV